MKTFPFLILLVLGAGSVATAAVLVDQVSIPVGNPHQGNIGISSSNADAIIEISQAWDNFSITDEVDVTSLQWTGAYNNTFNPDGQFRGETDFQIQFMPDVSGRPDVQESNRIAQFLLDGGTAGRNDGADVTESLIPNQTHRTGGAVVRYEANLTPFKLDRGNYWLSIQAVQKLPSPVEVHDDPQWSWVLSTAGDKHSYSYDEAFDPKGSQPGVRVGGFDTTFTLIGNTVVAPIPGDFNKNGELDVDDIDELAAAVRAKSMDLMYDVDGSGMVDAEDHSFWYKSLFNTLAGDADLNRIVNFEDFLALARSFQLVGGWADGNSNTDEVTDFEDFLALARNFEKTTIPAVAAVPESHLPASMLLLLGSSYVMARRRSRSRC